MLIEPKPASELGYWYRYEDVHYAPPLDEYDIPIGRGRVEIRLIECRIIKHTPKGVWLYNKYGDKRFVRADAIRMYACPTEKEALESYIARKKKQIRIYRAKLEDASELLLKAQNRQAFATAKEKVLSCPNPPSFSSIATIAEKPPSDV